jgi:hypothetical protein
MDSGCPLQYAPDAQRGCRQPLTKAARTPTENRLIATLHDLPFQSLVRGAKHYLSPSPSCIRHTCFYPVDVHILM